MATKKESAFDGYVGQRKDGSVVVGSKSTRSDRARGMAEAFKRDYEGMRQAYETYRKPTDPPSKTVISRLAKADERTARAVQRAGRDSDNEKLRESRRGRK